MSFSSQWRYFLFLLTSWEIWESFYGEDGFKFRKNASFLIEGKCEWDKVFKNGESKFFEDSLKSMVCLNSKTQQVGICLLLYSSHGFL